MLPHLLALTLALAPAVVSGALYPKDSLVKMIDTKTFRSAMKQNQTTLVAFVANWCGHCQRMVPEYSKAALGLYPLIPVYAVDCDENKALCAEQGVKGFPTVKLFPRGKYAPTVPYDSPERTASGFYYFATRRVPNRNQKLYRHEQIEPWVQQHSDKDRVLLLSKNKDVPLLWKVLANKYRDNFEFGSHRDRKGRTSVKLGYEAGSKKESKVLVYPAGATKPVLFEGLLKYDSISKFFDSVIDGTADLSAANEAAKEEEFELSEEEQEIERKQEAQRLALAHGGFTDMIDFEEAVKKYGMDFHDSNGYGGMLSDMPKKKKAEDKAAAGEAEAKDERVEDPIHRILRVQREKAEQKEREKGAMPKTGDAGQIVLEAPTDAPHTPTATASAAEATPSAASEAVPEPEAAPVVEESEEQYEAASKQAAPEPAATPEPAEEEPAATPEPAGETEPAEEADPVEEAASSGHVKDEL